ncbi:MAG: choline/carnitine O-acyltransferase [Lautropia sp.]|nr:choline/carnitine O-acyltransferase [Lautropia sp.]
MAQDTAPTPRLPIPELDDTCQRYLTQLRPLLDDGQFARTEAIVRDFASHEGPALQAALQAFDATMAPQGKSWLIDAWLESYLAIRTPLPLSSNIGVAVPMHGHDLADWVAVVAAVHADHHHQRIEAPRAPTGAPVSMTQWAILQGAARIPQPGIDHFQVAPTPGRHVGVLHHGFYYRLAVLDEQGEALPATALRPALAAIRAERARNPYPLAVPCYLGSDRAAALLAQLHAQHPDNARLLACIHDDLFHVCLRDEVADADSDLAAASFLRAQDVWCYKPVSLIHNAATGRLHLHCEHTMEDGATLLGIMTRAATRLKAQASPASLPAARPETITGHDAGNPAQAGSPDGTDEPVWRQGWHLDDSLQQAWSGWQADYARQADARHLHSLRIPFDPQRIPAGISQDALMQLVLQYAQLATWGAVRNTYEAVDASHFVQGRTECVRPVSLPSVDFVRRLLAGTADAGTLKAALAEHKARIKACKQGLGPNRHLLGLQLMARQQDMAMPALFSDEGYRVFTTDVLSTSTLGRGDVLLQMGFAPTSEGGLGVNYTLDEGCWLYTVTHVGDRPPHTERFMQALAEGAQRLLDLLEEV